MNLSCKLFVATFAVSAVAGSAALAPLAAAPITLLDGLRKAPAVDVQTVQGTPQGTQQLGPDYGNIGPRGGSQPSGNQNAGERSNTGNQLGPDYGNNAPRSSGSSGTRNVGEPSPTGQQGPLGR